MADEKQIESQNDLDKSEDQAAQPQEIAEAVADPPSGDQPAENDPAEQESGSEGPVSEEAVGDAGDVPEEQPPKEDLKVVNEGDVPESDAEADMLAMLEDLPKDESGASPEEIDFDKASVAKAEFQQLSQPAGQPESKNIDLLMDINLPVSIELGRTKMSIADILGLGPGSVVELNKLAGEPVDVLVNYKIVAKGEVVVIDENFGVRITQLMTPEERLKLLGEEQ
jgi:flagellar motor switch protein FliN/FliY